MLRNLVHFVLILIPVRFGETITDLVSNMLALDPSKRISIDEALKHPYFRTEPRPFQPYEYVISLSFLNRTDVPLTRAVLVYMPSFSRKNESLIEPAEHRLLLLRWLLVDHLTKVMLKLIWMLSLPIASRLSQRGKNLCIIVALINVHLMALIEKDLEMNITQKGLDRAETLSSIDDHWKDKILKALETILTTSLDVMIARDNLKSILVQAEV